jgi:Beta-lactamase enzyme family
VSAEDEPQVSLRSIRVVALVALIATPALAVLALLGGGAEVRDPATVRPIAIHVEPAGGRDKLPSPTAMRRAWAYARDRGGMVSVAVIDTRGRLRGRRETRRYVSASVVKAMLLAAELDRLADEGLGLDSSTEQTLRAMITYSDNAAADSIYYRIGDAGLYRVARAAGMKRFAVSGYWANAQVTAADLARLFARLDAVMAGPEREFALGLLGSVIPEQSWGVPDAAAGRWAVRFKGGWRETERGSLVHQVAELRRDGRSLAIAVLTDGQRSQPYAIRTVRGVARRLLAGDQPSPPSAGPA